MVVIYGAVQTTIALDLYLAYLRAAFHTCYYCAVITDHLEELQRKCIMHVRKPLTKAMKEEIARAAAVGDAGKDKEVKDEDMKEEDTKQEDEKDGEQNGGEKIEKGEEKEKEGKKDAMLKERSGEASRNWQRNGTFLSLAIGTFTLADDFDVIDDRWLDWLDSKIALLIDRDGVDPRTYGGKSYDEYVPNPYPAVVQDLTYLRYFTQSFE